MEKKTSYTEFISKDYNVRDSLKELFSLFYILSVKWHILKSKNHICLDVINWLIEDKKNDFQRYYFLECSFR